MRQIVVVRLVLGENGLQPRHEFSVLVLQEAIPLFKVIYTQLQLSVLILQMCYHTLKQR